MQSIRKGRKGLSLDDNGGPWEWMFVSTRWLLLNSTLDQSEARSVDSDHHSSMAVVPASFLWIAVDRSSETRGHQLGPIEVIGRRSSDLRSRVARPLTAPIHSDTWTHLKTSRDDFHVNHFLVWDFYSPVKKLSRKHPLSPSTKGKTKIHENRGRITTAKISTNWN